MPEKEGPEWTEEMGEHLIEQTNQFWSKNEKLIKLLNDTVVDYGQKQDAFALIVLAQCLMRIATKTFELECVKDVFKDKIVH